MRKPNLPKRLFVLFSFFLLGSSLISGCTSKTFAPTFQNEGRQVRGAFVVNINTADAGELEKLPHVGPVLAAKIVEHRKLYGPFRKPEHLLIVDGLSEKRFQEFRQFINTE